MLTVNKLIAQGLGLASILLKRAATVELDWSQRQEAQGEVTDSQGRRLKLALPAGSVLRGGDVLVAEDGSMVRVLAAAQAVLFVRACPEHGSALDLQRAAYHLGRRQVAVQLGADELLLEPDPALRRWLHDMHLQTREGQAAFEPEGQAPAHAHAHAQGHGHDHGHDHDHDHGHHHDHAGDDHGHEHPHRHEHEHEHAHGSSCGHGHAHDHDHEHPHAHERATHRH